ncbi:GntR family transcriptional regulator, partial [Streptomyces thioluteus]|uniref:GntR family transcriptional regulator n=1 Tax=Streptomyces thioluteus TaxID=66431 RepID=UPI0031E50B12
MEQGRPHPAVPRQRIDGPGEPARAPLAPLAPLPGSAAARGEHVHGCAEAPGPGPARRMPTRYSVRGQVLDALRKALLGGELIPGEVYSGPVLAERFGVSATPVREAMQQLVQEGAVEAVP